VSQAFNQRSVDAWRPFLSEWSQVRILPGSPIKLTL
jgi:hypothetical protein